MKFDKTNITQKFNFWNEALLPDEIKKIIGITYRVMRQSELYRNIQQRIKSASKEVAIFVEHMQMELESMLGHGCDLAVKEILSVKSDWTAGKKDLVRQLVVDGKYDLPENRPIKSRTKQVVDQSLKFLKD